MAQTWWWSDPRHSWFCTSIRSSQRGTSSGIFYQGSGRASRTSRTKRPCGKFRSYGYAWFTRLARTPWETRSARTNGSTRAPGSSWATRDKRWDGVRRPARTGWVARIPGKSNVEDYNGYIHALLHCANGRFMHELSWITLFPAKIPSSIQCRHQSSILSCTEASLALVVKSRDIKSSVVKTDYHSSQRRRFLLCS